MHQPLNLFRLAPKVSRLSIIGIAVVVALATPSGHGDSLNVNNPSFESPAIPDEPPYAGVQLDHWGQIGSFGQTGQFYNTDDLGPPVQNADGERLAFIFANESAPDASKPGIFQDIVTGEGSTTPINYEVGQSYTLSIWVQGGGGGMVLGVPLSLQFYYINAALPPDSQRVTISTTSFPNDNTGGITAISEKTATLPAVAADDDWAGKPIGIRIQAIGSPDVEETGYWDADRVTLTSVPSEPWRVADINGDGQISVADVGILATNFGLTIEGGRSVGDLNLDGSVTVADVGILATYFGEADAALPDDFASAIAEYPELAFAVPEPASAALLAFAVPLAAMWNSRRQNRIVRRSKVR